MATVPLSTCAPFGCLPWPLTQATLLSHGYIPLKDLGIYAQMEKRKKKQDKRRIIIADVGRKIEKWGE
jgi:hypothetical protein